MSFKNKNIVREFPFFSHFACLPLIGQSCQGYIMRLQGLVEQKLRIQGYKVEEMLKRHNYLLGHLTLLMLTLRREDVRNKLQEILREEQQEIKNRLTKLQIIPQSISYFTRVNKNQKCNQLTVIYLSVDQDSCSVLADFVDYLVRVLLKHEIIVTEELKPMRVAYNHKSGLFQLETFHVSLFRCKGLMERGVITKVFQEVNEGLRQQSGTLNMKFLPKSLDVSTMMAFDETEFYQPFYRMIINQEHNGQTQK